MAEKKYDAFISYRHAELDKFVAVNLHKKLEAFKLPKGVVAENGKTKIERVFRDQDELPLSSNLSDPINEALEHSDFLIVICTPRLPESQWCKREIETFIRLHGREKILAVLAEGEPYESFPEALTKEEYEVTNPDGSKETKIRTFEPLAADVRGKNNKEVKKKLDDAVLRISAALFGLGYDDLKQRHKERKMKRTLTAISGIATGLLLFSAVCIAMMFKIMVQSEMILDQNNEISARNREITQLAQELEIKNEELTEQYNETHRNFARATANNANTLMNMGRQMDAIYALRRVMPSSLDDTSLPYTPETQLALTSALEVYHDDSYLYTGAVFETDASIVYFDVSPDNKYLLIADTIFSVHVYDTETGEEIYNAPYTVPMFGDSDRIAGFLNDNTIIYNTDNGLIVYNITDNSETVINNPDTNDVFSRNVECFKYNNVFFVYGEEDIYVYDSTTLKPAYHFALSELPHAFGNVLVNISYINVTSDNKYLVFFVSDYGDTDLNYYSIDLSTGEVKWLNSIRNTFNTDETIHTGTPFIENNTLYVSSMIFDTVTFINGYNYVTSYDLDTGKINWNTKTDEYVKYIFQNRGGNNLFAASDKRLFVLDSSSGEITYSEIQTERIIFMQKGSFNGDTVDFFTEDNYIHAFMGPLGFYRFNVFNTIPAFTIEEYVVNENGMYLRFEDSTYITHYYYKYNNDEDAQAEKILMIPSDCEEINKAGDLYMTIDSDKTAEIFDSKTGEKAYSYKTSNTNISFVDDGSQYLVAYGNGFEVFDFVSKKALCAAPSEYIFLPRSLSCDRKYILGFNDTEYAIFSLLTGERVATFPYDDTNEPDEIMLINKDTYSKVVYGECLKVYTVGDSNPCYETEIALSKQDDIIPCTYKDSICIFYKNGNVEMYSIEDTFKLIKSFYSMDGLQGAKTKLIYYPEKDIYVMTYEYADCTYVLNSNFEQIALLPATAFYIEEENKFISYGNFDSYMIPFYSYEELIKMADEKLGIYHPSQRIINQFNIK